jgi:hypothetical protein
MLKQCCNINFCIVFTLSELQNSIYHPLAEPVYILQQKMNGFIYIYISILLIAEGADSIYLSIYLIAYQH